jgi:Domain of unknown function (DUF4328)/Protein of unknown function (DUF2510)
VSGETRAPGWYPDPWDTPEERYFDGVAWARTTRRPGGLDTPPDPDAPVPPTAAILPPPVASAPATTVAASAGAAPGAPPGWHPDPWAAATLRYWDGQQWTGHVSGMASSPAPTLALAEEHTASRWARLGLAWAGPALGVGAISGAFQWRWVSDHWDALTKAGSSVDQRGNSGAAILGQLAAVILVIGTVLFLLWFHRSASVALRSGLQARRTPAWATASFLIPVLNLWWPYQSTLDLLPEQHPARQLVRRWWLLWIGCLIGGVAIVITAFANTIALGVATGATVLVALFAAVTARAVIGEITEAHDQLLAGA